MNLRAILATLLALSLGLGIYADPAIKPGPLGYAQMVYDRSAKSLVLYGGQPDDRSNVNDTWIFDPAGGAWRKSESAAKPPLGDGLLAYDSKRGLVFLFVTIDYFNAQKELAETWSYDCGKDAWTRLEPGASPAKGLLGARMAYDSRADRLVLFGGYSVWKGKAMRETWTYDIAANAWKLMSPKLSPQGRNFHDEDYDEKTGKVVLWGGEAPAAVWDYSCADDAWSSAGSTGTPSITEYGWMSFLPELGTSWRFGGEAWPGRRVSDELWEYDDAARSWRKLEARGSPGPRAWHAMAYDDGDRRLYLYGGGADKKGFKDELWSLDVATMTWQLVSPR